MCSVRMTSTLRKSKCPLDGVVVTSDVTSTEKMPNGDWYHQIHTELEYTPKAGKKISCMVEHAGFQKPMIYDWSKREDSDIPM